MKVPFLSIFPGCEPLAGSAGGLDRAEVESVVIDEAELTMTVDASFAAVVSPGDAAAIENSLRSQYGLAKVTLNAECPRLVPQQQAKEKPAEGRLLYGKPLRKSDTPVDMSTVTLESGYVTVRGEIFAVSNREIQKRGASILSFDMTDRTGSLHISKFISRGEDASILGKVKPGMFVTVRGKPDFDKFYGDMVIEPLSIEGAEQTLRPDTHEGEKRVELHLHTRYSTLDALPDPAKVVERAAAWGMKAVAVTDHGTAQSFPEMSKAGKKYGVKILYGIEGYFINDVDGGYAVRGESELPLDAEFIAFDVETTGLSAVTDRLTEIGAVRFSGGRTLETFSTFVNPGMHIPANITELTGIRDSDVADAPGEAEAMRAFIDFCGGRPIIAHNASFDTGFMAAACERSGIEFKPVVIDTLILAQRLLPELRRHKLDIVSKHLGLPEFNHHRAFDDAEVVARMMDKFIPMLHNQGVERLSGVNELMSRLSGSGSRRVRHISILVRNKTGLKNLYKLISASYLKHYQRNPVIPKSLLAEHREGLLIGSACEAGEVFDSILRGAPDRELRKIAGFYDYFEVMPLANNRFLVENGTVRDDEGLRDLNRRVVRLAKELEKPFVATGDVHFLDPSDEIYRRILLAAKKFSDADRPNPLYFRTTDEMLEEFAYLGRRECYEAVIKNPNDIAGMCEEIQLLPDGLFPPRIENSDGQLKELVYGRMHEIYGENPPEIVSERVETELHDILSRHYDVIYMSAQKLVADSNAHGYLVGSRGSVGSSLVAYMSGITEVNSLPAHYVCPNCHYTDFESGKGYGCGADMPDRDCPECGAKLRKEGFDIPFETFLGFGGDKVPDIDLNFSGEYQAKAHKYTEELFGSDHVFRAGTIGTLAEKTAYGYVLKYKEERGLQFSKAEESRLAMGLVGVKRTTGQHPGGLVVIPQDMEVEDFCPVQHPADDPGSGIITTHFEYHSMEANLLKLDELGHDDPTMLKMLEDMTGYDVRSVPLDDPETRAIFKSPAPLGLPEDDPIIGKTGTIGIPEFGTGFTRQMLVDTRPEQFDTLVRLSGYSHGTDVWLGNAKDLILSGTATVKDTIGCRDDIMLYLISMGMEPKRSFKIMEAVRKGRGLPEGAEQEMLDHGVPEWYIGSCKKIKYLFPKAHAVAYVMMGFRIAFFKVHYPLQYYSAYFYRRSQKDAFDAAIMIQGVDFVRRKINEIEAKSDATAKESDLLTTLISVYEFYMRGFSFANIDLYESDESKFLIVGDSQLRPPFVSLSGLGEAAARDLAAAREGGREFISVEELSIACPKLSQAHIEQLKAVGALGSLPEESQMTLF